MNGSPHNGQSSPLGLLPPADFGGTPRPFGFASRLGRETLLQRWSHQIPLSGNPLRLRSAPFGASCHNALNPTPDTSVGKPLRVRQMPAEGDPPAALVSPPAVLAPQGTTLGRTGSPRRCLLMTND
jgi:hypothetical protein